MSTLAIVIVVVVVLLVLALVAAAARRARRRRALREQFGPEYDRTVAAGGSRRQAERELAERTQRREELDIQPLSPTSVQRYRSEWRLVQERFVDAPAESVAGAHQLLAAAMQERGYPTGDSDDRAALLSVDHADVIERYRQANDVESRWRASGTTDTEDLRQAMQHYRAVFDRVVGSESTTEAYPAEDTTGRNLTGSRIQEQRRPS